MHFNRKLLTALAAAACLLAAARPAQAKIDISSRRVIRNAPISQTASDFAGTALSTFSIKWTWSTGTFTGPDPDGYYLYSSTAATPATRITLPPGTSFYIDTGLGTNRPVTRWVTAFDGADESSDSPHVIKHTFATPPPTLSYGFVTSSSAYLTWSFSSATAYAIEASSDAGVSFVRIRDAFVPWQTVSLLSNTNYLVRLGAINHDQELTPGVYSSTRSFTTYPLDPEPSAVAVSSYAIQWQWSTGPFTGTGITGYKVYRASATPDGELPPDDDPEILVATVLGADTSSWIETYIDSAPFISANSRHTRWIKATGIYQSTARQPYRKYTYGTSDDNCTGELHENHVVIGWNIEYSTTLPGPFGIAATFAVEHSTVGNFTAALGTVTTAGSMAAVTGLESNTKYDFIVRPINGDGEVTPENAQNPFARTAFYKGMTRPVPPYNFQATPLTDTILRFTWSTMTYHTTAYIDGYLIEAQSYYNGALMHSTSTIAHGVDSTSFDANYMLTNSTQTCDIQTHQIDPDCGLPPNFWCYAHEGSEVKTTTGSTYATPPNDVAFSTVGARFINLWWLEPQVPATKYRVERSTTLGESGPWVFVASATGSGYYDTGLTPTTTYSYRIGAINLVGLLTSGLPANSGGNRRDYSYVSSTITKHIAPALVGVAYGTTTINWSWTDTLPGVTAYNLHTATEGVIAVGLPGATTFYTETVTGGANTSYTRRLRSVAAGWVGDYSEATVTTLVAPPAALTVTSSATHALGLGWTANGSTRYALYRSTDAAAWTPLRAWSDVFVSTWYADSGLYYATTYYYALRGYNSDGIISASSATAVNMTLALPSTYTVVYATAAAAQSVSAPLAGLGLVTVSIPAGLPASYFVLSTSAATSPTEVTKAALDSATAKLTNVTLLAGSVVELRLYSRSGVPLTSSLPSQARLTIAYPDANNDDEVDGTAPAMDARTLRMFTLNAGALTWERVVNSTLDRTAKTVYADLPHFSIYMLGSVTSAAGTLADMFAYPNPYRPGSSGAFGESAYGDGIVFESMPARSKVRIFSLSGAEVAELNDTDGDGRAIWDARNKDGAKAASGIYFYVVSQPTGSFKKTGRIAIIR